MKRSKVWVVLGAAEGLGYAAVKYLIANKQTVIAVTDTASPIFSDGGPNNLYLIHPNLSDQAQMTVLFKAAGFNYESIDYIINNGNYRLFLDLPLKTNQEIEKTIHTSVAQTIDLIAGLLPFLHKNPTGYVINIPPQLCLASIPDPVVADHLATGMDSFLKLLHRELQTLDCGLKFLEPGERLLDFAV